MRLELLIEQDIHWLENKQTVQDVIDIPPIKCTSSTRFEHIERNSNPENY